MTTLAWRRRLLVPAVGICLLLLGFGALRADEPAPPVAPASPEVLPLVGVAFQETVGDVVVHQYEADTLSQLSYLVGSGGKAIVVDPLLEVGVYLRDATALGLEIETVLLTHTHSDFVAGHAEIAATTGARVLVHPAMKATFEHVDVEDGQTLDLGSATLEIAFTPGPTADGLTLLVHAPETSVKPLYALTGDTLLLGTVGRPEALYGAPRAMDLAASAFAAIQRLRMLPDETRVLPAHGGGPYRGMDLGDETIGLVRDLANPFVATESSAAFVSRVLNHLPAPPPYAQRVVERNLAGRRPEPVSRAPETTPEAVEQALAQGAWLIDLRMPDAYAKAHVPGSVNIPLAGRLEWWFDRVVPRAARVYLLGTDADVDEAVLRLRRVARDGVDGRLAGGLEAWMTSASSGRPVRESMILTPKELAFRMAAWVEPVLVDVRPQREFASKRLGEIANIPLTQPARFKALLDPTRPILTVCKTGFRSAIAVGLLERMGFEDVGTLDGGIEAWAKAGLPVR